MCWNWDGTDAESISILVLFETQRKDAKGEREKKEDRLLRRKPTLRTVCTEITYQV
jgi:hypothetical protein